MRNRVLIFILVALLWTTAACQQVAATTAAVTEATVAVAEATVEAVAQAADPTATSAPATATAVPTETPAPTATAEAESGEETADAGAADASELAPAPIVNDEGGPVNITGEVTYTNPFFTLGVAEPVVILEDQAGFVDRNESFLMPVESQTLGQITSDFFDSPFSYSLALPMAPQGTLRDVDNDGEQDEGVQVFAVAYWTNTFGDPYLEERDLFGGGWSTAYASTLTSTDADTRREVVGGKLLVYAADEAQGFPRGFGEDGLLFTKDDPVVRLPAGYTVVDLDTDPFTFDRAANQVIDLIEPESSALVDYSDLSYTEAFDALVDQLSKEYAFTEYKGLDWEAIRAELRPRFEEATQQGSAELYRRALRDLARAIPDGHVSGPQLFDEFLEQTGGGLGLAIRELDDGRVVANFVLPGAPADAAGLLLGAEILEINDQPIAEAIAETVPHSAPFSTEHVERLQQLRYVTRFPVDTEVTLTFRNPDEEDAQTVTLRTVPEGDSFAFSSFEVGRDGFELPVEYELLDGTDYGYVQINSFSDNELLTIQLWERLLRSLNENGVPGLIVDMRQNRGGSGFLADQMAAYFFDEPLVLGNTGRYDEDLDTFFFDPRSEDRFFLPAEELRYDGAVTVLIGPNCNSACEFFAYDMTLQDRAAIVGQYPTAGLGGSIDTVAMPEGENFTFTAGRAVDADGEIHIEGKGVPPTVIVPVTEETLFGEGDAVLEAAVDHLNDLLLPDLVEGGDIAVDETVTGTLEAGTRTTYVLEVAQGEVISLFVESEDFDPVLLINDTDGNVLLANDNASEGSTTAAFEGLEIPLDLVLVLHVAAADETGAGDFELRIEASE